MSAAISALIAGGALAQDTIDTGPDATIADDTMEVAPTFVSLEEMTVGDMTGMRAYDPAGDSIGDIDYVISVGEGAAAVIGIGGFLGIGEYTVAVALEEFQLREDGVSLLLNTDKETLKNTPETDETDLESLPDDVRLADLLIDTGDTTEDDATDDSMSTDDTMSDDTSMDTDLETDTDTSMDADIGTDTDLETDLDSSAEAEGDADTTTTQ
jgi:hypothetical protein